MRMRLAFAVASHIDPEVLLIDEVLAVGDLAFQKKCMNRLKGFKRDGCTGLIVSHAPQSVLALCDDAIWLDRGRVVAYGPAHKVVGQYVEATGGVLPPALNGQVGPAATQVTPETVTVELPGMTVSAEAGSGRASLA